MTKFGDDVLNKLTVEWFMSHLTKEEQTIFYLSEVEEYNNHEIGEIIGRDFRDGKALSGSAIRYHKTRILKKLKDLIDLT